MNTIAPTSAHPSEYPQALILPGVRLQEALKHGRDVQTHFDTYCRRAFRRAETAKQGTFFLLNTFEGRMPELASLISIHHLVCEMNAGSHFLTSSIAAHWDKTGNFAKLAELAESVTLGWNDQLLKASVLEFLLALASAVAIKHPERTKALLDRTETGCTSPELHMAWADAREWQHAGELLIGADPSQTTFWHQQLVKAGGPEIWNTSEARQAVALLEKLNPEITSMRTLFAQVVPGHCWSRPLSINAQAKNSFGESEEHTSVASVVREQIESVSARSRQPVFQWIMVLLVVCATSAAFWKVKGARFSPDSSVSGSNLSPSPKATSPQAIAFGEGPSGPSVETDAVANDQANPRDQKQAASEAQESAIKSPAQDSLTEPPSEPPPPKAKMLSVKPAERAGWVLTPLGEEISLAASASNDETIVDSAGRLWALKDDEQAVSPTEIGKAFTSAPDASREAAPVSADVAGVGIPSSSGGPSQPIIEIKKAESAQAALVPMTSAERKVASETKPVKRSSIGGHPNTHGVPKGTASRVSNVIDSSQRSQREKVRRDGEISPFGAGASREIDYASRIHSVGLHPDYFKQRPHAANSTTWRPPHTFVTRANNIRMTEKGGYWESAPSAYLSGAGDSPEQWARDMTLRERSSGTIPKGYEFEVKSGGIVRVVPVPAQ